MSHSDSKLVSGLLQLASLILVIQNLLLSISLALVNTEVISDNHLFLKVSFFLDLPTFGLFILLAVVAIFLQPYHKEGWFLVSIGSAVFVLATLVWRPLLGFIPENIVSDILFDIVVGDVEDTSDGLFTIVSEVSRALLISNTGLLIFSVGFFILINRFRYLILLYGLLNFIMTLTFILIPLKAYLSLPFIIVFFGQILTNSPRQYLRS